MAHAQGITRQFLKYDVSITAPASVSTMFPMNGMAGFVLWWPGQSISFTGSLAILHSLTPDGPFHFVYKRDGTGKAYINMANVGAHGWVPAPTDVYELPGYIKLERYATTALATKVTTGTWTFSVALKG